MTSLRGKVPGPSSSSSRRVAAAVARLGRTRAHGSIVSLRPRPLVRGRVALGFTAPRAIASDKIPKSAENEADTAVEPSVVEKTSPGKPTPPKSSAVIDVESLTSTASTETTPEPESDGGDGGENGGSGGSGGGGDDGDHSSDGSGGKAPGPELPESMVALASWAVSQTKDWSAAADGGLRAAFGTLVGVNCVTVMLIRSMRGRSEKKRLVKDDAKRAAAEAKNIARHEEELAAMSKKREMAQVSASAGGSAIAAAASAGSGARSSAPAFPPRERDTWDGDNEVLNSTGAGVGFATNNPVASVAATDPVEAIDASAGGVSFPKSDVDADEADDFLVRALESYDAADALIGGPSGADIALATNDNTATREDMLAFAVIPDDARDPRVVAALGDAARAQAAAANAMAAAAAATKRAAEATDAAQRLQRAIAAGATEAELAAAVAATSLAADRAVEEGSRAGYAVTSGAGTVDRALNVAGEGIGRVAGAVARGVSVATPAVVDGARRYVPAGLDAVSRGAMTVWDGSVSSEGIRAPGLKQRALAFLTKVKQHQRISAGAKAGVSSAEGTDGKDDVAAGAAV